jgi:6-phosphogluconate dehydrogenase
MYCTTQLTASDALCRRVIILVKAGSPVDQTIEQLSKYMEPGDIIIDGGNEWWVSTPSLALQCFAALH